jgi:hypothetical protein
MLSSLFFYPCHWLHRAEEMRALADDMKDDTAKKSLLRLAEEYEKLAKRAEVRSTGTQLQASDQRAPPLIR